MIDLVQHWFQVWEDTPGTWVIEEPLHGEGVKSYLVLGDERAALIDTGMGVGDIRALVQSITALPVVVLQSHAHNDHIGGAHRLDDVRIHASEAKDLAAGQSAERLKDWLAEGTMSGPLPPGFKRVGYAIPGKPPSALLADGDMIDLGGRSLEVWHTPGHSRGSLVFLDRARRDLYSTDVVYLSQLYLLNPDSSVSEYVRSLERLSAVVDAFDRLYPSHGPSPVDPPVIVDMLAGMREIERGRKPDRIERHPLIDGGGAASVARRAEIRRHEFGVFDVLVASDAKP